MEETRVTFKEYVYIEEKTSVGFWKKSLEEDGVYILTDYLLDLIRENKSDNSDKTENFSELDSIVAGDGVNISGCEHNGEITVKVKKSFFQKLKDYIPSVEIGAKEVFDSNPCSISTYGLFYFSIKNKFYSFQLNMTESKSNGWFFPRLDYKLIKM